MISPSGGDDTPIIQAAINTKGYAELDSGHIPSISFRANKHTMPLT